MPFARTEEYESLFARGYPNLRRLISPHPDEADAERHASAALDESDPGRYQVDWPAEVAFRFVRGLAHCGEFGIGFAGHREAGRLKQADAGLKKAGAIDAKEGRALISALLSEGHSHYGFQVRHGVLLLEAMLGSALVVDAVLGEFERMKKLDGQFDTRNEVAYSLGFVLRRLPAKERAAAEERVRKLVSGKPQDFTRDFLSYLVGGRKALEDSGRALGPYCMHFCDDPALIREIAADDCATFDVSHAFLAGEGLFTSLAKQLRKLDLPHQRWLIAQLTFVASRKVDPILAELAKKKALGAAAQAAIALRSGKPLKQAPSAKKTARRPSDAAIEKGFEALTRWLAAELGKVRGKKAAERKVLTEAAARYASLKTDLEQPPDEALVHFFGADGCGWQKHRKPALQRLDPSDAELTRWTEFLAEG